MSSGRVWLTADTHFYHAGIIGMCGRPYKSVEEMNEKLVKGWNSSVNSEDTVIHLGDTGLGKAEEIKGTLSKLNGHKVLIKGNHDKRSNTWYLQAGFDSVSDLMIIGDDVLTHRPVSHEFMQFFRFNLHGHHHSNISRKYRPEEGYFCLSVERTNYRPVLMSSFLKDLVARTKKKIPKYLSNPGIYEYGIEDATAFQDRTLTA